MSSDETCRDKPCGSFFSEGTSSTLYVVGWSERTGRVLVEEWVFGDFPWASLSADDTAREIAPRCPSVSKSLLWVSSPRRMDPVWDGVCQVYADELWLLESGEPTVIHALDLASLELTERYSSAVPGQEGLAGCMSMAAPVRHERRRPRRRTRPGAARDVLQGVLRSVPAALRHPVLVGAR